MKIQKTFTASFALLLIFSLLACANPSNESSRIEFEVVDNFSEQLLNYNISIASVNSCGCCQRLNSLIPLPPEPDTFDEFNERAKGNVWIGRVAVIGDHETVLCSLSVLGGYTVTTLIVKEQFSTSFNGEYFNPGDLIRVRERHFVNNGELLVWIGRAQSWFGPLLPGDDYIINLCFFQREPILIDGEMVTQPYDATVAIAFPVNDRENDPIYQRFEATIHQSNIAEHGLAEANERLAFRQMLIDGAREKYLGIAPPVSGQPPLETE